MEASTLKIEGEVWSVKHLLTMLHPLSLALPELLSMLIHGLLALDFGSLLTPHPVCPRHGREVAESSLVSSSWIPKPSSPVPIS